MLCYSATYKQFHYNWNKLKYMIYNKLEPYGFHVHKDFK